MRNVVIKVTTLNLLRIGIEKAGINARNVTECLKERCKLIKKLEKKFKVYMLQIITNDDVGFIRDVKVTHKLTEAKNWFNKQPKNGKYSHGYMVIDI